MVTGALLIMGVWIHGGEPPKLPEGVLAIVEGEEVTLEAYKDYLWQVERRTWLRGFVDQMLLEKKARELGVTVSEEEVRRKVEEETQRDVELFHKGDVQAWRSALAKRWWTPADERARKAVKLRSELLQAACVLATRVVTEEQIRKRFERDYGPGGIDYELRQIVVSARRAGVRTPDPDFEAKARAKAERILRELRDGADFEEMVSLYSDDAWTKPQGGAIPKYRPNLYRSEEFDAAVRSLTEPGQLSGLVKTRRGFHILQLIRRRVTNYEDVKEELRQILTKAEPEPMERIEFVKKLRAAARITR